MAGQILKQLRLESGIPQLFEYLTEVISNADWRSFFLRLNRKHELCSVWQNAILNIWVFFHGDRDLTGIFISFLFFFCDIQDNHTAQPYLQKAIKKKVSFCM